MTDCCFCSGTGRWEPRPPVGDPLNRAINEANRYQAWLFQAWRTIKGQNKGLNRLARKRTALTTENDRLRRELAEAREWKRLAIELMQEHPNAYASDILDSLPSVESKP